MIKLQLNINKLTRFSLIDKNNIGGWEPFLGAILEIVQASTEGKQTLIFAGVM